MNLLARFFSIALIITSFTTSSCNNERSDSEIQNDVTTKLTNSDGGKSINATVTDGVVTLTGECKDDECRKDCAEEVREVKGVKNVVNNIQIASLQESTPADNSQVEIAPDNTLTSSVNEVVKDFNKVEAEVKDGIVTLRGEVKRSELPELIQKLNSLKVRKVDNQLVIK